MKYIKLDISFSDKLKLLFFGLISEDILPTKEVIVEKKIHTQVNTESNKNINIDIVEEDEKLTIPFFEMDNDDIKSNF